MSEVENVTVDSCAASLSSEQRKRWYGGMFAAGCLINRLRHHALQHESIVLQLNLIGFELICAGGNCKPIPSNT